MGQLSDMMIIPCIAHIRNFNGRLSTSLATLQSITLSQNRIENIYDQGVDLASTYL